MALILIITLLLKMENFEILRACYASDFRNDPDTKLHLEVNQEMT
jgi:hypothetical protein